MRDYVGGGSMSEFITIPALTKRESHLTGFLVHDCEQRENSSPIFSGNATGKWAIMVNQMILPLARLLDNGTIWACKCRSQGSTLSRLTGCQRYPLNGAHCVAKHCSVLDYFQCRFLPVRLKLPPPPAVSRFIRSLCITTAQP